MKTKLVITDSHEVFKEYRDNNIASKDNSRTVWLHDKESFEELIKTAEDCDTYEIHLANGYNNTFIHHSEDAKQSIRELCSPHYKHKFCLSCDFYNVIPTLEGESQIQKALCGAGKSLEGVKIESCSDYEEKDIQQRAEKERALVERIRMRKVEHLFILLDDLYPSMPTLQPHQRAMLAHNELVSACPQASSQGQFDGLIAEFEDIKNYLGSCYRDEMFPKYISRNEASRMILCRIISVIQAEQSNIQNRTNVVCNVLLIGRDYYHQLFVTARPELRRWAGQEANSRMFDDYIWQYTRLKIVRTLDSNFKLVFDSSISENS